MTISANTTSRNAYLTSIRDLLDAGTGPGKLLVMDGVRPAAGGTPTNVLAELTLSDPCAANPANGVLTFNAITGGAALQNGTASWVRLVDSDGNFVCDGSVGATGSGADVEFGNINFVQGGTVNISSGSITAPDA